MRIRVAAASARSDAAELAALFAWADMRATPRGVVYGSVTVTGTTR
jgi:hypothetical protein